MEREKYDKINCGRIDNYNCSLNRAVKEVKLKSEDLIYNVISNGMLQSVKKTNRYVPYDFEF